jgi:hypothetical protein
VSLLVLCLTVLGLGVPSTANADCVRNDDPILLSTYSGTIVTCGGDDVSYRIPIGGVIVFRGFTYSEVYATTNSVLTFGIPHYAYESFPPVASISIRSKDWIEDYRLIDYPDEYFTLTVNANSFRVDLAGRSYRDRFARIEPITLISMVFTRQPDNTLRVAYFTNYSGTDVRDGCIERTSVESEDDPWNESSVDASAISLEECGLYAVASLSDLVVVPESILIATAPVSVAEVGDEYVCSSGTFKYLAQSVQEAAVKIDDQTYGIKVDGNIVAQKSSLESRAGFSKSLVTSGSKVTCFQYLRQGDATSYTESTNSGTSKDALIALNKKVEQIREQYKKTLERLNSAKSEQLRAFSERKIDVSSYQTAVKSWSEGIYLAKQVRENSLAVAQKEYEGALNAQGSAVQVKQRK